MTDHCRLLLDGTTPIRVLGHETDARGEAWTLQEVAAAMIAHQIRFAGKARWFALPDNVTLREANAAARELLKANPTLAAQHTEAMRIEFEIERRHEMSSVQVRWQHDAAAEVVEFQFPLSLEWAAHPGLPHEQALKAHRKRQMELLRVEDEKFYPPDSGLGAAGTVFAYAICRQDSGKGGWCEVRSADGEKALFAHPRARARELGCEWVASLGPESEAPEAASAKPKRRQKVAA